MKTLDTVPARTQPEVLVIGTFDGLHRGHRYLIDQARKQAQTRDVDCSVLTFKPDPELVLREWDPDERRLLAPEDKIRLLERMGIDRLYQLPFDRDFASLSPETFVEQYLLDPLQLTDLYVGENFRFGSRREGTPELLNTMLTEREIDMHTVETLEEQGRPISSTRIRQALQSGELEDATRWLGRPYVVYETIVPGAGLGTELGFPTLNFQLTRTIHPKHGVYAAWLEGKRMQPSVVNFGTRPTVEEQGEPLLEVHVLDDDPALTDPDKPQHVHLVKYLRDEQSFTSEQQLTDQIARDIANARTQLDQPPKPMQTPDDSPRTV